MKLTKAEKLEMDYTQYTERAIDARLETIKAFRLNRKLQWTQADILKAIDILGLEKSDIIDYFFVTEGREV